MRTMEHPSALLKHRDTEHLDGHTDKGRATGPRVLGRGQNAA